MSRCARATTLPSVIEMIARAAIAGPELVGQARSAKTSAKTR